MSQISNFISQKKKGCIHLEKDRQIINKDIMDLELQKYQVNDSLNKTSQKEQFAMAYLDWNWN
jgi:hypothetical protein